jgi:hypothetical protein
MTDLSDFIYLRLSEVARAAVQQGDGRCAPAVNAKKQILEDCSKIVDRIPPADLEKGYPYFAPHANLAYRTLQNLASEWSDHPDYQEVKGALPRPRCFVEIEYGEDGSFIVITNEKITEDLRHLEEQ